MKLLFPLAIYFLFFTSCSGLYKSQALLVKSEEKKDPNSINELERHISPKIETCCSPYLSEEINVYQDSSILISVSADDFKYDIISWGPIFLPIIPNFTYIKNKSTEHSALYASIQVKKENNKLNISKSDFTLSNSYGKLIPHSNIQIIISTLDSTYEAIQFDSLSVDFKRKHFSTIKDGSIKEETCNNQILEVLVHLTFASKVITDGSVFTFNHKALKNQTKINSVNLLWQNDYQYKFFEPSPTIFNQLKNSTKD